MNPGDKVYYYFKDDTRPLVSTTLLRIEKGKYGEVAILHGFDEPVSLRQIKPFYPIIKPIT